MAQLKPFRGIRPAIPEQAELIASRPYDVLNRAEARKEAGENSFSFLHVTKPEIDLPDSVDEHDESVYLKGASNFKEMLRKGLLQYDDQDCLYIYAQTMDGRTQYGLVGCASVEDYLSNVIKKHELTRPDKEEDRKKHIRISGMNYEPVFFAYPAVDAIDKIVAHEASKPAEYSFTTNDGIGHQLWMISKPEVIEELVTLFAKIPNTYVADGHHRTAAAALVGKERRDQNPTHTGKEEYNYFLAVHFPDNQLKIFDYNRLVTDLNGLTQETFLQKLSEKFTVAPAGNSAHRPTGLHNFGLYMGGQWYSLTALPGTYNDQDPIGCLDVTVLSNSVLDPILSITDLRHSKKIDFVGGIRGLGELERRVDSGEMVAAFALYPVSMQQLIDIADTDNIMPPKTTWFEPKLRSGLVIHSLD